MSGGIKFSEKVFWGKAGWVYRTARDGICAELKSIPGGEELGTELSAESHAAQWGQHLDLRELPENKKKLFFQAVHKYVSAYRKNPSPDSHAASPTGFLVALNELEQFTSDAEQANQTLSL
ncbi:MAG: hypothetical protein QM715_17050 [Nibricoccus sp.]